MVYHFIDQYKTILGLRWLLRKFQISPNAYYNYLKQRKATYRDYMRSLKKNDEGELIDENAECPKDVGVYMNIVDLRIQISVLDSDGTDDFKQKTIDNIKEIRNKLAKKINYKD